MDCLTKRIVDLESRRDVYWHIWQLLDGEFVSCVRDAGVREDFMLVMQANVIKRQSEMKMVEINIMEQNINVLMGMKRKLFYQKYIYLIFLQCIGNGGVFLFFLSRIVVVLDH